MQFGVDGWRGGVAPRSVQLPVPVPIADAGWGRSPYTLTCFSNFQLPGSFAFHSYPISITVIPRRHQSRLRFCYLAITQHSFETSSVRSKSQPFVTSSKSREALPPAMVYA